MSKKQRIVALGGGTGLATTLRGLRKSGITQEHDVTAIVATSDSGGFSGFLRDEKGILPPGDLLKALLASSGLPELAEELFYHRYADNSVAGHYMLMGMVQIDGVLGAIAKAEELLRCSGKILPATLAPAHLFAETNRRVIKGEGPIEQWFYGNKAEDRGLELLLRVFLEPPCSILPEAQEAIKAADLVIIGPGSFYTSLIACLEVKGMKEALTESRVAYIVNTTTHPKETPDWKVSQFVHELEMQIRRKVDVVICNNHVPEHLLESYRAEFSAPVGVDVPSDWNGRQVISGQFVAEDAPLARHDAELLAGAIKQLLEPD
jgi:uncharacterized cofD-like protein